MGRLGSKKKKKKKPSLLSKNKGKDNWMIQIIQLSLPQDILSTDKTLLK